MIHDDTWRYMMIHDDTVHGQSCAQDLREMVGLKGFCSEPQTWCRSVFSGAGSQGDTMLKRGALRTWLCLGCIVPFTAVGIFELCLAVPPWVGSNGMRGPPLQWQQQQQFLENLCASRTLKSCLTAITLLLRVLRFEWCRLQWLQ